MARPLRVRKPTLPQLRRLERVLESEASARQRRRAEVLLLYAAGHDVTSMAQALQVHPHRGVSMNGRSEKRSGR